MSLKEKIGNLFERWREKHKLTYINDTTYHEKWSFNVSALRLFSMIMAYTLLVALMVVLFMRFTGLGVSNSGMNDVELSAKVSEQSDILDSLYEMSAANEIYLENIRKILNNEEFDDSIYLEKQDSAYKNYMPEFTKSKEDSILRSKIEQSEKNAIHTASGFQVAFFFPPVTGVISQSFNISKNHFGVDVVTVADEPVKACLDGTVISSGWVPGEGNTIVIQHDNDLVSIYKHCSVLLKVQGDKILTGDPIGIVGNTGENTSGPHLHFELWQKGVALNPQEFISF